MKRRSPIQALDQPRLASNAASSAISNFAAVSAMHVSSCATETNHHRPGPSSRCSLAPSASDLHSRSMEARTAADWTVRRRLLAVPGVSQVVPIGGEVRQYQVLVDPERLRAYRVGLDEVLRAAEGSNENASGGVYRSGGEEILIRGLARARDLEEIGLTVVTTREGTPVLLEDIAEVRIGPKIRFGTAAVNAEPAVILSIQKQPGANTLELTERIENSRMRVVHPGRLFQNILVSHLLQPLGVLQRFVKTPSSKAGPQQPMMNFKFGFSFPRRILQYFAIILLCVRRSSGPQRFVGEIH